MECFYIIPQKRETIQQNAQTRRSQLFEYYSIVTAPPYASGIPVWTRRATYSISSVNAQLRVTFSFSGSLSRRLVGVLHMGIIS